jgi:hypothetical protein
MMPSNCVAIVTWSSMPGFDSTRRTVLLADDWIGGADIG